jgi:predicted nucleotide-binding protein (sugar kinase/HSP70/actin superfamily)
LKITLGDILKVLVSGRVRADQVAVFMPDSDGPCRFGQYSAYMKHVLRELGFGDVIIIAPAPKNAYEGIGEHARDMLRTSWRAVVGSELLNKLLLRIRPYETVKGAADAAYEQALSDFCAAVEVGGKSAGEQMERFKSSLSKGRALLKSVSADFSVQRPLIGVVGEIFCRLNAFSNDDLIRKVEETGGECWVSEVSEWLWYTDASHIARLKRAGRHITLEMLGVKLKSYMKHKDEKELLSVFGSDFRGYEEPDDINEILELARPYLRPQGALGEMILSVGKAVYLHRRGADGVIDINPFSCMNGIVCESVHPRLVRDCDGLPVRVLYYDGTRTDRRYEIEIFMDLVREYSARKKITRVTAPLEGMAKIQG